MPGPNDSNTHTVSAGESLSSIAAKYGFPDAMLIYRAACNEAFRRARPNPDQILPGDQLAIPPRPEEMQRALRARLTNLRRLRRESEQMSAGLEQELEQLIAEGRRKARAFDALAAATSIVVGLVNITTAGFAAMKLTGAELAKANRQLARSSLKFAYYPALNAAAKAGLERLGAHEGVIGVIGTGLHVVLNLTTPSYWAGAYINFRAGNSPRKIAEGDPLQPLVDAKRKVHQQARETLQLIDRKIRDTESQLLMSGAPGGYAMLYDAGIAAHSAFA
jgi:hypothetical protein